AVIFILLLVALFNNSIAKRQQELNKKVHATQDWRKDLLDALKVGLQEFIARGVVVKSDPADPLGLLVLVPEDGLLNFQKNEHMIQREGQAFLRAFTPRFSDVVCEHDRTVSAVIVEGHGDSTGTDEYNLELSQLRSGEVVKSALQTLQSADDPQVRQTFP